MSPNAIDQAEKETYQLVTFQYGDLAFPQYSRYTDWAQTVEGSYRSTPELEIDLPSNHGTFQESKLIITVPIVDDFIDRASRALPHSPIYVKVEDHIRGTRVGDAASVLTFFRGRVTETVRNKDGKPNIVAFKCLSRKSRLETSLAIPCNSSCSWTLFGPGCRVDGLIQVAHDRLVTIDTIDGKVAYIDDADFTSPNSPGGDVTHFWDRGYLTKDGIILSIRDWNLADPTRANCRRTVPSEWLGVEVLAVPGCHKSIEDCRGVWDNESAAGHFGYAMMDYNPLFEDPQ